MDGAEVETLLHDFVGVSSGDGIAGNASAAAVETAYNVSQFYEQGEEMKQIWDPTFVFFAYVIACVSSYTAVHLLDHGLWRCEELKKAAIIKNPATLAASLLGFGTVWCMHFVRISVYAERDQSLTSLTETIFLTLPFLSSNTPGWHVCRNFRKCTNLLQLVRDNWFIRCRSCIDDCRNQGCNE